MNATAIITSINNARRQLKGTVFNGSEIQDNEGVWKKPPQGWIKLNVDGATTYTERCGCGGVLRNEKGEFIKGFMKHVDEGDSLKSELLGLLYGLKFSWDNGTRELLAETDAAEVLTLVKEVNMTNHPNGQIIAEIQELLSRNWNVVMSKIPRNAKRVADLLAKKAIDMRPGLHTIVEPFTELSELIQIEC